MSIAAATLDIKGICKIPSAWENLTHVHAINTRPSSCPLGEPGYKAILSLSCNCCITTYPIIYSYPPLTSTYYDILAGSPLPPTSLGYNFTNCNTTISWLLPPTGSRDHHPTDGLTLRYALIPAARYEESVLMELANDRTNVTVSLLCNMVYDVTLFATSCRGSLKSENISINMTSPECPGTAV